MLQITLLEWVLQFDDDEPIVIEMIGEQKEYVIKISCNSNIHFSDGKGKNLKIFAREKQIVNTINLEPNGTNGFNLDFNTITNK